MSEKHQIENQFQSMREPAKKALNAAFAKLVRENRKNGRSLVIWRDGKVCHIPASEIEIPEDSNGSID